MIQWQYSDITGLYSYIHVEKLNKYHWDFGEN